jgi:large subunit ribosomal protein L15
MKLNQLAGRPGSRKNRMRVGRGIGSGKGRTGGRGIKGQKSRTGVAIKGFEGGQMPLHRRLPKRGFNNIFAIELNEINVGRVQAAVDQGALKAGEPITADALVKAGLLKRAKDGVRLIGKGELKGKLSFEVAGATKSALAAVEKAGGSVKVLIEKKQKPEKPEKAAAAAKGGKKPERPQKKAEGEPAGEAPA